MVLSEFNGQINEKQFYFQKQQSPIFIFRNISFGKKVGELNEKNIFIFLNSIDNEKYYQQIKNNIQRNIPYLFIIFNPIDNPSININLNTSVLTLYTQKITLYFFSHLFIKLYYNKVQYFKETLSMRKYIASKLSFMVITYLFLIANTCQTYHNFDNSNCTFYMLYTDQSCLAFDFIYCTWQIPLVYTNTHSTDWNNCTKACCDPSSIYSQTSDAMSQCQNYLTVRNHTDNIVMFALFGSFGFIFLMAVVCILLSRKCGLFQSKSESQGEINDSQANQKSWRETDSSKLLTGDIFCSICLEDNCFFELECHHIFHSECILTSFKNKIQCILCRRTTLQTVRVYCQRCFKFYYESSLRKYIYSSENTQQICQNCQNCQSQNLPIR